MASGEKMVRVRFLRKVGRFCRNDFRDISAAEAQRLADLDTTGEDPYVSICPEGDDDD